MSGRLILFVAMVAAGLAAAAHSTEPAAQPEAAGRTTAGGGPGNLPGDAKGAKGAERLREGTKLVDVVGTFQSAGGDSITFSRDGGKESFRVLENLALQRVGQALEDDRGGTRQWLVSGTITEFRGVNFLLVTKFVQLREGQAAAKQ